MTGNGVQFWNCPVALDLILQVDDPDERGVFMQLPSQNVLTEADFQALDRAWRADRQRGESLIRFLRRQGWLTAAGSFPQAAGASSRASLTLEARAQMRALSQTTCGRFREGIAAFLSAICF